MKSLRKKIYFIFVLLASAKQYAQHHSKMTVALNPVNKTLNIEQELTFWNQSEDTLTAIVLNDWNNAYSNKNTPLGKRFSDEFYRGFHLANDEERGSTTNLNISDENQLLFSWERTAKDPDFIVVKLKNKLASNQKISLHLSYNSKIPSDKFTKYGYNATGAMNLKNWFLTPARYENHDFIRYNNNNLDDIANAVSDFEIELKTPKNSTVTSDLNSVISNSNENFSSYTLSGSNRTDFSLFIEPKTSFLSYKTKTSELLTNLKENKISAVQKAIIINGVVDYVSTLIGDYPHEKIIISQTDYERNPFYGLNQLPAFLSPFSDEFIFEIKFLKTYLNAYLKNSLRLDPRKDNWIYDWNSSLCHDEIHRRKLPRYQNVW